MNKFKNFLKEHDAEIAIISAGFLLGVGVAGIWWLDRAYKKNLVSAACYGFWRAFEWYDGQVPDAKIKDFWLEWVKNNPDVRVL